MVRKAVIIAAGRGSRLNGNASKPLTTVGGKPLLTRVAQAAIDGGCDEVVVVTGFLGDAVEAGMRAHEEIADKLTFVRNERWHDLANGYSLLTAAEVVQEEFFLLMSDHIFDPTTLYRLALHRPRPNHGVLAVDFKLDTIFDMDDATKVHVEGDRIVRIGKEIRGYNAVDTGMFRLPTEVFDSLETALVRNGDCTLSDGIRNLADTGRMQAFDIGESYWQDVDTPESKRHAEWLLSTVMGPGRPLTPRTAFTHRKASPAPMVVSAAS